VTTERRSVETSSFGHGTVGMTASVTPFDRPARLRRAASIFGLFLLGALLTLPVPGVHLVAPPVFLIAGFVLARRRLRQELQIQGIAGPCPACGAPQQLPPPSPPTFPATLPCPGCGEFLKLDELR
jgi:hypothetical protein